MFIFFTIIIIAISLSMDTFSLSLTYGMLNISKKEIIKISISVGLFHFFMPIIGNLFGNVLIDNVSIDKDLLIGIIFLSIAIDLIISLYKEQEIKPIRNIFEILLFSLTVSIDSLATGTALSVFTINIIVISTIFMIVSFLFTYFGLRMGNILHDKIGKKAEMIGIILLISLSLFYIIH